MKRKKPAPWPPLVEITLACSDDFLNKLNVREEAELQAVWQSELYEVYVFDCACPDWPGGKVTWLSIKRRDKDVIRDWRHLQWIKNEVCGPDREALEMFPAEVRLVDTSNQFHLWVLEPGYRFPFGYGGRAVVSSERDELVAGQARQRPFSPGQEPPDAVHVADDDPSLLVEACGCTTRLDEWGYRYVAMCKKHAEHAGCEA